MLYLLRTSSSANLLHALKTSSEYFASRQLAFLVAERSALLNKLYIAMHKSGLAVRDEGRTDRHSDFAALTYRISNC